MLRTKPRLPRRGEKAQPADIMRPRRRSKLTLILVPLVWTPDTVDGIARACADAPAGSPCPCAALGLVR